MPIDDIENDPTTQMLMQALGQGFGQNWGQQGQQQAQQQPQQQVSVPTPPPAPPASPAPSPFDQYEQSVLDKLKNFSEDSIYKDKIKDYYAKLGIKNPNSWKGKLTAHMYEAGKAAQMYTNRDPRTTTNLGSDYKGPVDRLSDEARKEYEKEGPNLRTQAQEIFKTQRDREQNATNLERERMKQAQVEKHTLMLGQIANGRNEIAKLQNDVKNKVAGADIALSQAKAKHLDMVTQVLESDKDTHLLSPQMRDALKLEQIENKSGPDAANNILRNMSDMSNMKAPPSPAKAVATNDNPTWQRSLERMTALEKAKIGRGANKDPLKMGVDRDGNPVWQRESDIRNSLDMGQQPGQPGPDGAPSMAFPPFNGQAARSKAAMRRSSDYSRQAVSATISAIQQNMDKDFTGMIQGSAIGQYLRETQAWNGDPKTLPETVTKMAASTSVGLHTMGARGGGRISDQAISVMTRNLAGDTASADSLMRVFAAHMLMVDMQLALMNKEATPEEITPGFATYMNQAVEKMAKQAQASRGNTKLDIKIPSLDQLLQEYRRVKGAAPGIEAPATPVQKVRNKYIP